jgi:hypothetical protein
MEKLRHNIDCAEQEASETHGIVTVSYCMACGCFDFSEIECSHDFISVAFILADGEKIQIRQFCKKCFVITAKSESHSKYDLNKLPKKKLEEYRLFYCKKKEDSLMYFDELRVKLDLIKRDFNKSAYSEYLQSDHWKEIREQAMLRDRNTCQICSEKATEVHHLTYAHRDNEFLFELVSLCHNCHKIHY